jgi:gamma-glutamyltranspeptidase
VAVTAVDRDGWSVSLIQSVFHSFGAGLLEPDTGILLHNRGAAFVLLTDPQEHASHAARLEPQLRPPHTLCPILAEAPGRRVAIGCQGGRSQPLILAQVARSAADPETELEHTLSAPRWVIGARDLGFIAETVLAEPGAVVARDSDLDVVVTSGQDDRCGHVQVARVVGPKLEAAADPRADGRAAVIESSGV